MAELAERFGASVRTIYNLRCRTSTYRTEVPFSSRVFNAGRGKLSEDDVRSIMASGSSQKALAQEYGVSLMAINRIVRGRTWKHITAPDSAR